MGLQPMLNTQTNEAPENTLGLFHRNAGQESTEGLAATYANEVVRDIEKVGGQFLRDDSGSLHIVIKGHRVPLNYERTNNALAKVFVDSCGVTTLSSAAQ